jgi:hypothetical protein
MSVTISTFKVGNWGTKNWRKVPMVKGSIGCPATESSQPTWQHLRTGPASPYLSDICTWENSKQHICIRSLIRGFDLTSNPDHSYSTLSDQNVSNKITSDNSNNKKISENLYNCFVLFLFNSAFFLRSGKITECGHVDMQRDHSYCMWVLPPGYTLPPVPVPYTQKASLLCNDTDFPPQHMLTFTQPKQHWQKKKKNHY